MDRRYISEVPQNAKRSNYKVPLSPYLLWSTEIFRYIIIFQGQVILRRALILHRMILQLDNNIRRPPLDQRPFPQANSLTCKSTLHFTILKQFVNMPASRNSFIPEKQLHSCHELHLHCCRRWQIFWLIFGMMMGYLIRRSHRSGFRNQKTIISAATLHDKCTYSSITLLNDAFRGAIIRQYIE